jgi:hypothetical protein
MPRRMPNLHLALGHTIDNCLELARTGEKLRSGLPANSPLRRELSMYRLESLYEASYLNIFIHWELFLEESFVRYMCGFVSSFGSAVPVTPPFQSTIASAYSTLLGPQDYLLWSNPSKVKQRCAQHIVNGLHQIVITSNEVRLSHFAAIRHRIAHGQEHAKQQFDSATMSLAGRRYPAARPGRFLRDPDPAGIRWLETIAIEFKNLAAQITP